MGPLSSGRIIFGPLSHQLARSAPCLSASPARLRVSRWRYRPLADRAFGHAASPRRCARRPGLPVSRARRSLAAPPDCAPVCFGPRPKRSRRSIRLPRPGSALCLLASGKPAVKTHTHECGSISSGWPPNQPASRIAKLFGEGGAGGGVGSVIDAAPVLDDAPGKLLRPASRRLRRP